MHTKNLKLKYAKEEFLYLNVYKWIAFRFIDKNIIKEIKHKKVYNPYLYKKDMSFKRSYRYFKTQIGQYKALNKYNR